MSKTKKTTAIAAAVAVALTIAGTGGAPPPANAQTPEADPRAWYEAVRTELKENIEDVMSHAVEQEIAAGALAQLRMTMEGGVANLDREMEGLETRIQEEEANHNAQEEHFCSTSLVAHRLWERVFEEATDAQDALLAGIQCRTAYRGAVSRPAEEEIESLRKLCSIARDRIVEHHDNPAIVHDPVMATLYAMKQCAGYRGAAWVAYSLTGSVESYTEWADANETVNALTVSVVSGEFAGPGTEHAPAPTK